MEKSKKKPRGVPYTKEEVIPGPGMPVNVYEGWGLMEDMKKVVSVKPDPKNDSLQLKACRKLFREDYKGFLQQYERLLKMETAAKEAEVRRMELAVATGGVVKREELVAGGQERRVEELIGGLLQEMKS